MNPHDPRQSAHPGFHARIFRFAAPLARGVVAFYLISLAAAQSAANFDTKRITPEAAVVPAEKTTKSTPADSPLAGSAPSRLVSPDDMESYMQGLSSVFVSRGRTLDPFGQLQDPDAKPVVKAPVPGAVKRIAPILATPFPEIIQKIVVTTIMPGEKRFLVGTRTINQGDLLPLLFRGKQIRVQVTEVTSRQIAFKNLDSGEIASRKLDMLPVGMTPGTRGITAPGMTLDRPNAPIELEMGEATP